MSARFSKNIFKGKKRERVHTTVGMWYRIASHFKITYETKHIKKKVQRIMKKNTDRFSFLIETLKYDPLFLNSLVWLKLAIALIQL